MFLKIQLVNGQHQVRLAVTSISSYQDDSTEEMVFDMSAMGEQDVVRPATVATLIHLKDGRQLRAAHPVSEIDQAVLGEHRIVEPYEYKSPDYSRIEMI